MSDALIVISLPQLYQCLILKFIQMLFPVRIKLNKSCFCPAVGVALWLCVLPSDAISADLSYSVYN